MALVNGNILKGDVCPYKDECMMMISACNGKGCPFVYKDDHFCDFSCSSARLFKMLEDIDRRRDADCK